MKKRLRIGYPDNINWYKIFFLSFLTFMGSNTYIYPDECNYLDLIDDYKNQSFANFIDDNSINFNFFFPP